MAQNQNPLINRRQFAASATAASAFGVAAAASAADAKPAVEQTVPLPVQRSEYTFPPMHSGRRPEIAMLIYPGLTILDMLGPQTVLAAACNVHLV